MDENEFIQPEPQTEAPSAPAPPGYPFWGYDDLAIFLGLALPCLLAGMILGNLVFKPVLGQAPRAFTLLPAQFLGYGFWFLALWMIFRTRYNAPFWSSLRTRFRVSSIVPALALGVMLAFAVGAIGFVLKTPKIESPMMDLMRDPASLLLVGLFSITLGPICEELAFRGFMLPLFQRSFGSVAAIVLTAVPFALLHGSQYAWSWRHILLVALAGYGFGWMRVRTGSTGLAAVMHAAYNGTLLAGFFFEKGSTSI